MKYGDKLAFFVTLADEGKHIPALEEKPELYPDLFWVWEAFSELNQSREIGFSGPQPLKLSEIRALIDELEITSPDNRWRFIRRIRVLDKAFLEKAHSKPSNEATVKNGNSKRKINS